ncbi:DUF1003 domain-containing protein [Nocardia terpenica]|uniref:DUF1003 domain-containing protein n=1 Tax=Nocardia terpenica TaxID=455432 RepID=UPI001895B0AD|nr:DUF1003 domain-containing protein [Nocardia terpenica]MBF6059427.1 DUF1003 domain-containing protein [Nocardia terpenica]MBF6103034.1 DUF1003 domain-containing protein [Nocardia terpenica]MBF6110777.1 DUF1003 domain-containing protein [Nocardia terpenica]MBF6116908.1 DUF1003 domain-containing protein [Nocardia terpenica]MBF6151254.1 DUF1003 domain-containing protein [Nocardia terpenica]
MTSGSHATDPRHSPVSMADQRVGVNDAVAAAVTRWVGSMPALYAVLVVFGAYMTLATWWGPLHRLDPYPYPFLLFVNNIAQLVLCLIILVGQRVLSAAADRRAVQTYENTESIFTLVADLQSHLDRQDRALSRGLSLLESSPHPWIEQHHVRHPPQARDQVVTRNDRIAAWLTERVGSVWAFYLAAGTQVLWILLAVAGVQRFDPYPFLFMTFLSTLAQLLFMIVIMVGQDVLGRAGDRRSEQTFLDAEAILHECRQMKARLTAQDRVIDSLTGYITARVTDQLAQAVHDTSERVAHQARVHEAMTTGEAPADAHVLRRWEELPDTERERDRVQARRIGENLATIGCFMVPAGDPELEVTFDDDEVRLLARLEYDRWMEERIATRAANLAASHDADDALPLPWDELPDAARVRHLQAARRIPIMVSRAGFQVLRGRPRRPAQRRTQAAASITVRSGCR